MKKKIKKILAVWFCVVIFATVFAVAVPMNVSASPTTFYVGGSGANNCTSIQSAVNDASSGDTIYVYSGTYYEHVTIGKSLTLQGEDRETTVVDGSGSGSVIYITANYVTISGFKVTNGEYGINLIANWAINHITIRDVIITSIDSTAFYTPHSGGYHLIEDSIISNNEGVSYAHQFGNSIIRNCEIFGNKGTLSVSWGSNTLIANNKVHHNIGSGIHFDSMRYSTIEENELYNNGAGITIGYVGGYNTIRNNIVRHNNLGINMGEPYVYGNKIYHNDLIENTHQAHDGQGDNTWDDGYPSGGNYWSDYVGVDYHNGVNQNIPGSDGIGDTSYIFDSDKDNYPLMSPWNKPKGPEISVEKEFVPSEITTLSQGVVSMINTTNIGDVDITSMTIIDEYVENMAPKNTSEVFVTITSDEGEVYAIMPYDLDVIQGDSNITISFELPSEVVPVFWEDGKVRFGEGTYYLESIPYRWTVSVAYPLYPISELTPGTHYADAMVTAYSETGESTTETATGTLTVSLPIEPKQNHHFGIGGGYDETENKKDFTRLALRSDSHHTFFTAVPADISTSSKTLYVGGTGPNNYTSIQDAIDAADPGDTIYVYAGTYYENVHIYKTLTLQGEDRGTTIIDGGGSGNVVHVTADSVDISGFTVQNGYRGIYLNYSSNSNIVNNIIKNNVEYSKRYDEGLEVYQDTLSGNFWEDLANALYTEFINITDDVTVFDTHIWGYSDAPDLDLGIYLDLNGNYEAEIDELVGSCADADADEEVILIDPTPGCYIIKVLGYWVTGNPGHFDREVSEESIGIFCEYSSVTTNSNTITNNKLGILSSHSIATIANDTVSNNSYGIYLYYSLNSNITNSSISLNDLHGIYIMVSSNNSIENCDTTSNGVDGIHLYYSSNNSITKCDISSNGIYGIYLGHSSNNSITKCDILQSANNIYITECSGATISGNNIVGSIGSNIAIGIHSNATISGNDISGSQYRRGIVVYDDASATVHNNEIHDNEQSGMDIISSSRATITNNNITSNRKNGITIQSSTATVAFNNIASNNEHGVYLDSSSNSIIDNNDITNNNKHGINAELSDVVVTNNYVCNNSKYGIYADSSTMTISDNEVSENGEKGEGGGGPSGPNGPDDYGYTWDDAAAYNWIDATMGSQIYLSDDDYRTDIPLGFDFEYYGVSYNQVNVMSNGWLSFVGTSSWYPSSVPSSDGYTGVIALFGRDLYPAVVGGAVYYTTQGTAPNRMFIVEYYNVPTYYNDNPKTMEVILYESSNIIKFQYQVVPDDPYSIGIEKQDETTGIGNGAGGNCYINPNIVDPGVAIEFYPPGGIFVTNTLFSDDMESGVGSWMSGGLWHQVGPGDLYQEFNSPTHSWWYGQDATGDYDTGFTNSGTLRMSSAVTISAEAISAKLSFYCWYETETSGTSWDQRWVQIKVDGAPWSDLEQLSGEAMNSWHQHIIDVSAYIGSSIQIGFRFDTIDSIYNNFRGWYIDDVEITESVPTAGGGIYLADCSNSNILNNIIRNNSEYGIYADSSTMIISDNEVSENGEKGEGGGGSSGPNGPDDYGYTWDDAAAYNWIDATTGAQIYLSDDDYRTGIPLGFDFEYYGVSYNHVNVMSNGWLSFVDYGTWYPSSVPSSDGYNGVIALFGRDLNPAAGGNVYYTTQGTTPNRMFIVEYYNVPTYYNDNPKTMEVILYESSNIIKFQYQVVPDVPYSIGIEKQDETTGIGDGAGGNCYINPNIVNPGIAIEFYPPGAGAPSGGGGIYLADCSNSNILNNTISNHSYGLYLDHCNGNVIYHNNFINNTNQAYDDASASLWSIETVDSAGDVGMWTSIALDSNNRAHISYWDYTHRDLKYAKWTGSTWAIEAVDSAGDVGCYTSIALDSNNRAHISYYDQSNHALKYAKWTGSGWNIEIVDSAGDVGKYTSIALDSNDHPHVSYYDNTNGDLKYAKWDGSAWNIETVDSASDVGQSTSLALDSNDYPHISYWDYTNWDIKYAKRTGSVWNVETVDSRYVGEFTSLALDSNDYPHISYWYPTYNALNYAKRTGSVWNIETVESIGDVGRHTSIALDSNDYPHISYHDHYPDWDLKYTKWTGSVWSIETVDSAGYVGFHTSIVLDSNDYPHISYYDGYYSGSNQDLKYVKFVGVSNKWDNGYPSGGNYWSDYDGEDNYSGEGQNIPGSDGIGDTPYLIEENSRDNYPLMTRWVPIKISVSKEFIPSEITTMSQKVISSINITNIGDVDITSMTIIDEYVENMAPNDSPEVLVTITSDEGEVYAIMPWNLTVTFTDSNITISFDLPLWVVPVYWENGMLQFGEELYYLESIPKDWVVEVQYSLYPVTELEIGTYYADATVTAYSETGASTTETSTGMLIVSRPIEPIP